MKYPETEVNNETQSIANTKPQWSKLSTTVMHKHQNNKFDLYVPFPRFLLSSCCR